LAADYQQRRHYHGNDFPIALDANLSCFAHMRTIVSGLIGSSLLASCTPFPLPVFLNNASSHRILVSLSDYKAFHIQPGRTKKIRGLLNFRDAAIQVVDGSEVSLERNVWNLIDDYSKYDPYICVKVLRTRIDARFTDEGMIELLPCDPEGEVLQISSD
jgi:hypothetical protein